MRSCNYIAYVRDHSSHCVNWRMCAAFGSRFAVNARSIIEISPIAAQIRIAEYWSLNMRSCKYFVNVRNHSSHSVNWGMCAVFGAKFVVQPAWNCRHISISSADPFSRILKCEYAEPQLYCICQGPQFIYRKLEDVRYISHKICSITGIQISA
jgi:hypothetical protein